jgi:hypothetical protein
MVTSQMETYVQIEEEEAVVFDADAVEEMEDAETIESEDDFSADEEMIEE